MKFSLVVLAAAAATGTAASPLTVSGSTSLLGQLAQLTSLPTCAVACINASAQKAGTGSLSLLQLSSLCKNVTGVLNGATVCLQTCKLPVAQLTQVTTTLKTVCATVKL
ncbi:hypothetical protein PFICI_12442 [Pestalotiopsis fici W106-1]|uniref:Extracellular membrane protein CFEM domain-containing protein n=1 Tax=Pestalotiopsis fici (strain W106-1 / CGMCC3.15140) TaxID=1229662 RepID=W3WNR1_PESFW|nr:uncharacterized protein PFICI_12442 [Pestalotiopsis fici W106-1]ETS75498.1 hypothetical protein PFICI_12442 [Pestalotiopsis fici W106-1]